LELLYVVFLAERSISSAVVELFNAEENIVTSTWKSNVIDFSFLCTFVPGAESPHNDTLLGTFVPRERTFRELSFPGSFVPVSMTNISRSFAPIVKTISPAVAKRPCDASCPSVASFVASIVQYLERSCFIIRYFSFGFTSAYNSILLCFLRRNVNPCCHTHDLS